MGEAAEATSYIIQELMTNDEPDDPAPIGSANNDNTEEEKYIPGKVIQKID